MYHCASACDKCCVSICKCFEDCGKACNRCFSRPFSFCVFITFFILFLPSLAGFFLAITAKGASDCDPNTPMHLMVQCVN